MELETQAATTDSVGGAETQPTGIDSIKQPSDAISAAAEGSAPAEPAYAPNYKFKVMDSEHEVDEWVRPVIKSKEMEQKVKDLYSKAYGLDAIKPRYQSLREEHEGLKSRYSETERALSTLGSYVKDGDFDSFFEGLNIPKNKIMEYALELVRREQMPPEQRMQWEEGRKAREAARYYEMQNASLMESQQRLSVQQRTFELDMALNSPEAKAISESYNSGMGSDEAFREYCIQIGQAYAARGQDISAQQAVAEATRQLRAMSGQAAPSVGGSQVVSASSKPVIPNIQGRGTSPVKPTVKSLDDLKKRAKEMSADY